MCIGFWLECLKETDYFEKLGEDGKIILKYMLKETQMGGGSVDWICNRKIGKIIGLIKMVVFIKTRF